MTPTRHLDPFSRLALGAAVMVPVLYFGAQIAAAPFYPGFNVLTDTASQLGSDRSRLPAVLNAGAILTGVAGIVGAAGFARALPAFGAGRAWAALAALCALSSGAAAIWAGCFPLPDPRHNPGALGSGTFLAPLVLLAAVWKLREARGLRTFLLASLGAVLLLAPVLSGATPIDRARYAGLLQRAAALLLHLPPAMVALHLLRWDARRRAQPGR